MSKIISGMLDITEQCRRRRRPMFVNRAARLLRTLNAVSFLPYSTEIHKTTVVSSTTSRLSPPLNSISLYFLFLQILVGMQVLTSSGLTTTRTSTPWPLVRNVKDH